VAAGGVPRTIPPGFPDIDPDVFDFNRLGPVYRWDAAKLQGSVQRFLDYASRHVASLDAAAGDLAALREVAHSLKGSAGTVGAKRLGTLAASLEAACLDGRADTAVMLVDEVTTSFAVLDASLRPFLMERSAA
jgi:HPt (histidine-containing phosphotransfer) domain-containing protein